MPPANEGPYLRRLRPTSAHDRTAPFDEARVARAIHPLRVGWASSIGQATAEQRQILSLLSIVRETGAVTVVEPPADEAQTEISAARALARDDCHLVITTDTGIISRRDTQFRELNLVTPEEAMVIVGAWCRTVHEAFLPSIRCNTGMYYWSTARGLTPAAWPAFEAWNGLERTISDGPEISSLATSVLDGLSRLLRGLDRMIALWQCETNNDTNDELYAEFVHLVFDAWAIHDNLALLAGRYLEIDLTPKHSPAWELVTTKWRQSMVRKGQTDARATRVLDYLDTRLNVINALREVRNDLAHRARGRMFTVLDARGGVSEPGISIDGDVLDRLEQTLANEPGGFARWGLGAIQSEAVVPVSTTTGESWQETHPRSADLDVVRFAALLTAHAAQLVNELCAVLAPASDPRLPAGGAPSVLPDWGTPEVAKLNTTTSGIAGLATWI